MVAYTNRHFRYLLRLISQHTVLYTEMLTAQAILHGDKSHLLDFSAAEHPIALQLGGSDPALLAKAAKIGEQWGYDEINLNVGCPSECVQNGCFGAALMKESALVFDCMMAMRDAVSIPVTMKTRLGVDELDSEQFIIDFIGKIRETGCSVFILHARKAWLKGLSPKENRDIPPLNYDRVYQLKKIFPDLEMIVNGGVQSIDEVETHLKNVDGVMIGRLACSHPYFLSEVDQCFYAAKTDIKTRQEIISAYLPYILQQFSQGVSMYSMTRHLIGLFQHEPGARAWRRALSENRGDDHQLIRAIRHS